MIKTCPFCKKEFETKWKNKKWCTPLCGHKAWLLANPEKRKTHWRKYLDTHRNEQRARVKKHYQEHREAYLEYAHQPKIRKQNNARTRAKVVLKNDPKICKNCGSVKNVHIHHIDFDPFNNKRENLEYLCSLCHGKKHRQNTR